MNPVKEHEQLPLDLDPEGFDAKLDDLDLASFEVKYLDEDPADPAWEIVPFRFLKYRPRCRLLSDEDELDQFL